MRISCPYCSLTQIHVDPNKANMQYFTDANKLSIIMEITFHIQTYHLFHRGNNIFKSDSSLQ